MPKSTRPAEEKAKATWLAPYHFKKGAPSPNPSGRPKRKPISDRYAEQIEVIAPAEISEELGLPPTATMGDVLARRMAIRAINSRSAVEASREMREAIEGKAPQAFDLKHSGEVTVNVTYKKKQRAVEQTV